MIRSNKWIKGTKPHSPVSEVASKSLGARLDAVWYYAPLAAKRADKDIEYVHQLRVSVRRARAAMRLYGDLLPQEKVKSTNKDLRRLRKAANDARDLDVLAERLGRVTDKSLRAHLDEVLGEIALLRKRAQKPLVRGYKEAKKKGFNRRSRTLIRKARWRGSEAEPEFAEFARAAFKPMVDAFFDAARADLTDVQALHQMRICGKQVRYGMELLAGAFDKSFRDDLYPIFGEVQVQLGAINDHATAITLFDDWIQRAGRNGTRSVIGELIVNEEMALDQTRGRFLDWWTAERAALLEQRVDAELGLLTSDPFGTSEPGQVGRKHDDTAVGETPLGAVASGSSSNG